MTVKIEGRNRYSDEALTTIIIRDKYRTEILEIVGGYIENRGDSEFVIAAKHMIATDEEGDSAYVVLIEGCGLVWKDMFGADHTFTGALLSAKFWAEGEAEQCIEAEGYLKFTPPPVKWKPGAYTIIVSHYTPKEA